MLSRDRVARALFLVGALTWPFSAYPLYVSDQFGVTVWNPATWTVPLVPLALILSSVVAWSAPWRLRAIAGAIVGGLAALWWWWPFGAGFFAEGLSADRFVAALAYPALAAAWTVLRGWGARAFVGLAPMVLVLVAATVAWPGPDGGVVPWYSAWRSNAWPLGPIAIHVSGAGVAAAVAAVGSVSLAERIGTRQSPVAPQRR